jgi:hypothetical protein
MIEIYVVDSIDVQRRPSRQGRTVCNMPCSAITSGPYCRFFHQELTDQNDILHRSPLHSYDNAATSHYESSALTQLQQTKRGQEGAPRVKVKAPAAVATVTGDGPSA